MHMKRSSVADLEMDFLARISTFVLVKPKVRLIIRVGKPYARVGPSTGSGLRLVVCLPLVAFKLRP